MHRDNIPPLEIRRDWPMRCGGCLFDASLGCPNLCQQLNIKPLRRNTPDRVIGMTTPIPLAYQLRNT